MSRCIRLVFAAAVAALLTLPRPAAAAGRWPAAGIHVGTPEDRAVIEKLMWSYDRMLDTYNADAYVKLFTEDGAFGQTKGREALHKMVADLRKGHDERRAKGEKITMRHFTMNQYLEFTGPTTARYHYYHQTIFGTGAATSRIRRALRQPAMVWMTWSRSTASG